MAALINCHRAPRLVVMSGLSFLGHGNGTLPQLKRKQAAAMRLCTMCVRRREKASANQSLLSPRRSTQLSPLKGI